jgi:hypothetical protein
MGSVEGRSACSIDTASKLSVALLVLLGVGAGMLYLKRYAFRPPSEAELRERVQSKNLLPVVKRVVDRVRAGEHVGLQDPEGVQLAVNGVNKWWSLIDREGGVQGVAFEFGGADRHYGIIVSEQGVKPRTCGSIRKLRPKIE